MKPEDRFGLSGIERRQQAIRDAGKPAKPNGEERIGRALVNLPWLIVAAIGLLVWLMK